MGDPGVGHISWGTNDTLLTRAKQALLALDHQLLDEVGK